MGLPVGWSSEPLVTVGTLVWQGAGVKTHVHLETCSRCKQWLADMADQAFSSSVNLHVGSQGRLHCEPLVALLTAVRFLSSVRSDVSHQVTWFLEADLTLVTLVRICFLFHGGLFLLLSFHLFHRWTQQHFLWDSFCEFHRSLCQGFRLLLRQLDVGSRPPPVVGALELARVPSVNRHVVLCQAAHLDVYELSQRPVFNQDFQVRCLTTQLFATVQNMSDLAKKIALIYTISRLELFSHRSIAFRASGVTTSERSLLMNTLVASKCCLGGESGVTLVAFDGGHLRWMCLQPISSMQKIQDLFSIGPPIFRTKMKNFLNQQGAFLHCFLGKVVLAGWNLFFTLVLKIRRKSKKKNTLYILHNTGTQTSSGGGTWVLLWLASSCAVAKTSLQVAHLCRCLVACCRTTGWAVLGCWGGSRCWLGEVRWVSRWVFMVGRSVNSSPQLPHFHL